MAGSMPGPLSSTSTSRSSRPTSDGDRGSGDRRRPSSASSAFWRRLMTTCSSRTRSATTRSAALLGRALDRRDLAARARSPISSSAPSITERELDRVDRRRPAPREVAQLGGDRADPRGQLDDLGRDCRGPGRSGRDRGSAPAFSAKVRIAATGWLISCATPAVIWPIEPSRLAWASSSRAAR